MQIERSQDIMERILACGTVDCLNIRQPTSATNIGKGLP